jgi:hypothetical protein
MRHRAVGLWGGFLLLGATALLGTALLVSGPAAAATCPYGPCTQATTVTPTTVSTTGTTVSPSSNPSPSPSTSLSTASPATTGPSSTAFTGADLALMFTIGAIAIGAGGMLVLVSRRRRSEAAYERSRGRR